MSRFLQRNTTRVVEGQTDRSKYELATVKEKKKKEKKRHPCWFWKQSGSLVIILTSQRKNDKLLVGPLFPPHNFSFPWHSQKSWLEREICYRRPQSPALVFSTHSRQQIARTSSYPQIQREGVWRWGVKDRWVKMTLAHTCLCLRFFYFFISSFFFFFLQPPPPRNSFLFFLSLDFFLPSGNIYIYTLVDVRRNNGVILFKSVPPTQPAATHTNTGININWRRRFY